MEKYGFYTWHDYVALAVIMTMGVVSFGCLAKWQIIDPLIERYNRRNKSQR